jgi:hypothetical protein
MLLSTKKESWRNVHKCLCNVYGSDTVDRSTIGHWLKRVMASKAAGGELHDLPLSSCPVTAVSPEMLQCGDAVVHEDQLIRTQQWYSVSQSAVVLVISLTILDIPKCAQDGFLGALQ